MDRVDCVVIGAGVIGLAVAREMALQGRETILLERESTFGTISSARSNPCWYLLPQRFSQSKAMC